TVAGTVVGPDGRPLSGVSIRGLKVQEFQSNEPLRGSDFTVNGLSPNRPRLLSFYHREKNLGAVRLLPAEDRGPLTGARQPGGTAPGGLLDEPKTPRAAASVWASLADRRYQSPEGQPHTASATADKEGRFRIEGLVPGVSYVLNLRLGTAVDQ